MMMIRTLSDMKQANQRWHDLRRWVSISCFDFIQLRRDRCHSLFLTALGTVLLTAPVQAQDHPAFRVTVNSPQDGAIQADQQLTLREAILLVNGTLAWNDLSPMEQAQVERQDTEARSRIEFDLPAEQTTIQLMETLPVLARSGLVVDGTTQSGYGAEISALGIPAPVVAIAPAVGVEIPRGLTLVADDITIRGLSLSGFTATPNQVVGTLPADIFLGHPPVLSASASGAPMADFSASENDRPPQNILIENNWIGMSTPVVAEGMDSNSIDSAQTVSPTPRSAFGISVFNAVNARIQNNWIANHDGSGIITAVRADGLQIRENWITDNGLAGMPDAIRLEGSVAGTQIVANHIQENAGSGVYLFKTEGAIAIRNNDIQSNGQRLRRAAIYLMGNGHQVTGNSIRRQPGTGVVVAAYPLSTQNQILDNEFADLDGLSIDLVAQSNVGVTDYQRGDGLNPRRNSPNRRLDTGNAAINAPQFLSPEFFMLNGTVTIDGVADEGSTVQLYRVLSSETHGPLSEVLGIAHSDEAGRFSFASTALQPGDQVSAIATDPRYGTSEPARNVVVRSLTGVQP